MAEKKFFDDVRFVRIEKLKGRAKEEANRMGLKEGLAILKMSINSLPEYEIEVVKGDPLQALERLGLADGITPERLSQAIEKGLKD